MAEVDKATLDAQLAALLVNNVSGDIEANELLAQFRDILDSYGNVQALNTDDIPQQSGTPGVFQAFNLQAAIQGLSQSYLGRDLVPTTFTSAFLTVLTDTTFGPGRKYIFNGTADQDFVMAAATATTDIGKFWIVENATADSMLTIDPAAATDTINGGADAVLLPGQVTFIRITNFVAGTPDLTEFEAYTWFRLGNSLILGRGEFQTVIFDNLVQAGVNESGTTVFPGTPLRTGVSASNNRRIFAPVTQSNIIEFVALSGARSTVGSPLTALSKGILQNYTRPIHTNRSTNPFTEPLSVNSQLFYDFTNARYDDTDVESGVIPMTEVVRSVYRLPNTAPALNNPTNVALNDASNVNSFLEQTSILGAGPVTVTLTDLRDGQPDSDAIPQGGEFCFVAPTDNGSIFIELASGTTNGFFDDQGGVVPGGSFELGDRDEARGIIVYRDGLNWRLRALNEQVIETDLLFDLPTRTHGLILNQVGTNFGNIDALRNIPVIDVISTGVDVDTDQARVLYNVQPTSNDRVVRLPNPTAASISIDAGDMASIWVKNNSAFWLGVRTYQDTVDFTELSTDIIYLQPNETRQFILFHRLVGMTSIPHTYVVGRIQYPFEFAQLTFQGAWVNVGQSIGLPGFIAAPVTGNLERLGFPFPGGSTLQELEVNANMSFTGTDAPNFSGLSVLTPSLDIDPSVGAPIAGNDATLLNLTGFEADYFQIFPQLSVGENEYIEVSGVDLTDVTVTNIFLRGKIVIKEA
ncbi:MAG: hypothetical protein ACR2PR_08735 [Pseudohongiellaceae bacterium]